MHIFISYAKKDSRELAQRLYSTLNTLPNITAWMDASLQPADSWASQIEKEIDRCDYVLVLLSPDVNRPKTETQAGSFVLKEINYAQAQNKRLIVAMAGTTKIPIQIADEQYIDFTQNLEDGVRKLVNFLLMQSDFTPTHLPKYSEQNAEANPVPPVQQVIDPGLERPKVEIKRSFGEYGESFLAFPPVRLFARFWSALNWGGRLMFLLMAWFTLDFNNGLIKAYSDPEIVARGPFYTIGGAIFFVTIFIGLGQLAGIFLGRIFSGKKK